MGLITLTCPACGAKLENLDDSRDVFYCTYCGNKITHDKTIVEHRGTVNLGGIANENTLLQRAKNFLEEDNFGDAKGYFDRVLDINPQRAAAYMGLLCCKYGARDLDSLRNNVAVDFSGDINYQRAMQYAAGEEKERFADVNGEYHQYVIGLNQRNVNIDEGKALIEKERQEAVGSLNARKSSLEAGLRVLQETIGRFEAQKKRNDKEFIKYPIQYILLFIAVIILWIVIGSRVTAAGYIGLFVVLAVLVNGIVQCFKKYRWINGKLTPGQQISKAKGEYNQKAYEINKLNGQINQINAQSQQRLNNFVAAAEGEKQKYMQNWMAAHPGQK